MDWEIFPFVGVGQLRFGMSMADVESVLGSPKKIRESANRRRETRDLHFPIVRFINGNLTVIEFFYDVESLHLEDMRLFSDPGLAVMRRLEQLNGGAEEAVGIVLFRNLGITTGRLDEDVRGEHSVTAFSKGLWDDDTSFKPISF